MGFWNQLYLLLWKNFTLHKRQKVRLVVEVVWPLLLFLILMWVRSKGLKYAAHQCYFEEKAMPSAGILPFIQNSICTFNNTCHAHMHAEDARTAFLPINSTTLLNFVDEVEGVLGAHLTKEARRSLDRGLRDFQSINLFVKKLTDPLDAPVHGDVSIGSLLKNRSGFRKVLRQKNVKLSKQAFEELVGSSIRFSGIQKLFGRGRRSVWEYLCGEEEEGLSHLLASEGGALAKELCALPASKLRRIAIQAAKEIDYHDLLIQFSSVISNNTGKSLHLKEWQHIITTLGRIYTELQGLVSVQDFVEQGGSSWERLSELLSSEDENRTAQLVQLVTCGRNASSLFDPEQGQGPARHFEELRQQMKNDREVFGKNDDFHYVYDNATTAKCNHLFRTLEMNQMTRMLWSQLKPFVRGKIIYAPDTPPAHLIMSRVNKTFTPLLEAVNLSTMWLDHWSVQVSDVLGNSSHHLALIEELLQPENVPFQEILMEVLTSGGGNETLLSFLQTVTAVSRTLLTNSSDWLDKVNLVVEEVRDYLQCFEPNRFVAFPSETVLERKGMELIRENKLWAGVVFHGFEGRKQLPHFVKYKIRMAASKVDSTKRVEDRFHTPGPRRRPGIDLKYITFGFAYLQDMIEHAIIREQTGRSSDTGIYLQQFPYPCYIFDQFIMALSRTFPLFMVLSWVYPCAMIVKGIVVEKEKRLKEVMRVMGLKPSVLWLSSFLSSFVAMAASCCLLMTVLVYGRVMENSDPGVVLVFLLCYCVSAIGLSFLLSVFFSRANIAAAAGGMLFFLLYVPYPFLVMWEDRMSLLQKAAVSLSSNVAFGFGCSLISHWEEEGVGVQWSNVAVSPIPGDEYSMARVMAMMLGDAVIYVLAAFYLEAVCPGQYGVPKPFYFLLTKSFWCGPSDNAENIRDAEAAATAHREAADFESEPKDLRLGVSLHCLSKEYSNKKVAVQDLSLNFYEGQITSFLGHNGAGKTTTISILTGMFPPTSGTARIYGRDIRKDMDAIRRSLGTCPQHNVLFDDLTVLEHLWFYARLKGARESEVIEEANEMIRDMNLEPKTNELSRNLSGGMQRKLSIGIAFVGGSQTVILDEPTAGVDPYARRSIWELLLKYKAGRTVILTTHHMDEADLLGDRIALIANGRLRCCGSSLFLKARFGNGYYLTLVKAQGYGSTSTKGSSELTDEGVADMSTVDSKSDLSENTENGPNSVSSAQSWGNGGGNTVLSQVTAFVSRHVPEARLLEEVGSEMSFLLPANRPDQLQSLFRGLDASLHKLAVSSYGVSDTSLEEVFLKVTGAAGTMVEPEEENTPDVEEEGKSRWFSLRNTLTRLKLHSIARFFGKETPDTPEDTACEHPHHVELPAFPELSDRRSEGAKLIRRQLAAFHLRRLHHTRRNIKGLFCEVVMPAGFICLALILALFIPPLVEEPPLELQPWLYGPPNHIFFSNEDPSSPLAQKYVDSLLSPVGMGTRCVKGHPLDRLPCQPVPVNRSALVPGFDPRSDRSYLHPCPCSIGTQSCPAGAHGPSPPSTPLTTYDTVHNLTGRNISDWLIKTRKDFYKQR